MRAKEEYTHRLLYDSQMNHASVALSEGRIPRVLEILAETTPKSGEPDLRGWEWHYLDRLLQGEYRTVTLESPTSEAKPKPAVFPETRLSGQSFPLSGNGRRLVRTSLYDDGYRFDVWDPTTGQLINRLPLTGQPPVKEHRFSLQLASGKALPGAGNEASPEPKGWGPRERQILPIGIFSPDGSQLGVWESGNWFDPAIPPGRLRIWNVSTGQELTAPDIDSAVYRDSSQGIDSPPSISLEASGVRWLVGSPTPRRQKIGPSTKEPKKVDEKTEPVQSREYVARNWDRASGQVASQRFRPGDGTDSSSSRLIGRAEDGRILLFEVERPGALSRGWQERQSQPLECWDVAATPPRRVWTSSPPPAPAWTVTTRISPGGKMVAVRDESGVTVYRTEDHAGAPCGHRMAVRTPRAEQEPPSRSLGRL